MNNQEALLEAVEGGNVVKVRRLVDAGGVNLSPPAGSYDTHPLLRASSRGYVDIVRILLDRGADVNQVDKEGWTALICAAFGGHPDAVLLLLQRGAHVNVQEKNGSTALHCASLYGNLDVIRVLLDHGADRTLKDNIGETAERPTREFQHHAAADLLRDYVPVPQTTTGAPSPSPQPSPAASPAPQPSPAASVAPPSIVGQTDELASLRAQLQATTDELTLASAQHVTLSAQHVTLRQVLEAANARHARELNTANEAVGRAEAEAATEVRLANQRTAELRACENLLRRSQEQLSKARAEIESLTTHNAELTAELSLARQLLTAQHEAAKREAVLLSDAAGALTDIDARRASSTRLRGSCTATSFTYTARLGQRRRRPGQRDAAFYGSCAAAYAVEPRAVVGVEGGESTIDEVLLPLCVKVMFNLDEGDHQGTQDMLAKFRAEWEILADEARLPWHPSVMRIYHQFSGNVREMGLPDYDADAGNARTVCMVMPRLETNLGSLISRRLEAFLADPPTRDTIFSAAEFFYYGLQLCLAVAHLHHHRIVHRDLYPANVLLGGEHIHAARDGVLAMPQQLLVSDFGCCLDATRDTVPGTFHLQYVSRHVDRGGNASYLAPEVMRAVSGPGAIIDYDKNDVFAAGRCLYAMVSTRDLLATCGGATHAYADAHFTPPNGFRDATAAADDDHVTAALRAMLRAEPTDRCSADAAVQMMARGHRTHPLE